MRAVYRFHAGRGPLAAALVPREPWRRTLRAVAVWVCLAAACAERPVEPLQLDGNLLTVVNRSGGDWTDVEVWINRQFRVTAAKIADRQAFRATLDHFVTGYGQRFDVSRTPIRDLRLTARRPDGAPFEIRKQFSGDPLADALQGMGGKR